MVQRRGYVLRLGGDVEIAGALADGMEAAMAGDGRGERHHPPANGSEAVRRVAMMRHTPEEWAAMTVQARYDYGQDAPAPRWALALLAGYGLICYVVSRMYHWQDAVLRGR